MFLFISQGISVAMFSTLGLQFLLAEALPLEAQLQQASQNTTLLWSTIITGWSDDPPFRGTSSILWSCLITILASVYTAIHVNIPLHHMTQWLRFVGKAKWAFIALVAPELVLQAAFTQRRDARKLVRKLEQIDEQASNQDPSSNEPDKTSPNLFAKCWQKVKSLQRRRERRSTSDFNMAYGFWVVMGGFVVETTDIHNDHKRIALTTHGVALLADCGYRIPLPKEQVADRTKASALAKSLVCAQVLWLLLQVFVRLHAGYPLTLLEIHATVHVVCALCIYVLWWHKPVDVDEPILINISSYKDIMAYMIMDSLSIEKEYWPEDNPIMTRSVKHQFEGDHKILYFRASELRLLILDKTKLAPGTKHHTKPFVPGSGDAAQKPFPTSIRTSDKVEDRAREQPTNSSSIQVGKDKEPRPINLAAGAFHPCGFGIDGEIELSLSPATIQRWILCTQALARTGFIDRMSNEESRSNGDSNMIKGWQIGQGSLDLTLTSIPFHIATLLLPLAYGGIHLAARNTHFPSATESLLWKISAITVMVFVPCCYLLLISVFVSVFIADTFNESFVRWLSKRTSARTRTSLKTWLDNVNLVLFISVPLALMVLMFSFSRLYLVVESFISLRAIPLGALAATPWVQSIPHL